jgi:DNA primase catalytic core
MRYTKEEIDEIKRSHDLGAYIQGRGVRLRTTGKMQVGHCPFHPDKNPSFNVDRPKQLFHCFGCGAAGDIFNFIMKFDGSSFLEAVARLAPPKPIKIPEAGRLKNPILFSQVLERYHRSFCESATAQGYISSRGIDPELAKSYKVGFADGTLQQKVSPESNEWKILKEIGIITPEGAERFADCVVFPLTAFNQYPVGLYGRSIGKDQHMYLPGGRRGLFNWNAASRSGRSAPGN